jgi:hypothetical protein
LSIPDEVQVIWKPVHIFVKNNLAKLQQKEKFATFAPASIYRDWVKLDGSKFMCM